MSRKTGCPLVGSPYYVSRMRTSISQSSEDSELLASCRCDCTFLDGGCVAAEAGRRLSPVLQWKRRPIQSDTINRTEKSGGKRIRIVSELRDVFCVR